MRGILTATGPIHQGGNNTGNFAPVKRITILSAAGQRVTVPAVSGNGIRGVLRRVSAQMTLDALAGNQWTYAQFSALVSGGQLTGTQKEWSDEQRVELSAAIPHFALFGVAGGKGMTPGQWQCSDATPVCVETSHLTGVESTLPVRMLTEMREGVRVDAKTYSPVFTASYSVDTETGELIPRDEPERATDQMIYSVEAIVAGAQFAWDARVSDVWPAASPWLAATIRKWQHDGGYIGGMSARGYGGTALSGQLADWVVEQPAPEPIDVDRATAALQIVT